MDAQTQKKISKQMSYILRHQPDSVGLTLAPGGWVDVDQLLAAISSHGRVVTSVMLEEIVSGNDKQRFEFSANGTQIRARQGHSTKVDLQYEASIPPDLLFHGTATRFLASIREQGLIKGNRHHVHLSTDRETMLQVAMRHGKPVLLLVDAKAMLADGHTFFVTGNDVWLTDHVPPRYLQESASD